MAEVEASDKLLTSKETAELIGVTEEALTAWRYRRQGPPFLKLGHKTVRYSQDDLNAWFKRTRVTTT